MSIRTLFLGVAVMMAANVAGLSAQIPTAVADLRHANGSVIGRAVFTQSLPEGGIWVAVTVSGLTPGGHGIHIHAVGSCDPPGFTSAGGHFNPEGTRHGLEAPGGPHAGDLPNMVVPSSGTAAYRVANYRITLGPASTTVFDRDGSALVIHAQPDDNVSDPAGNSGARVACGVIVRR